MIFEAISASQLHPFSTFPAEKRDLQFDIETNDTDFSLLNELPEKGLAIVGTRYPQRKSLELLEKTMRDLRGSELIIVSGLARGTDSKAHELAIENGLRTIAVLGCGIDLQYPRENAHLRREILNSGGMVLTHFRRGTPPLPHHFIDRNQFIAGLSKAVWVVEAAAISGTLNTASWASEFNRDLYATSCFPGDHFYQGNEKLLSSLTPERYPIAMPLFSACSLGFTWPRLAHLDSPSATRPPVTQIQRWMLELKREFGECHVQILMNHASQNKMTLGQFYKNLQKELDAGILVQDEQGRVDFRV